MLSDGKPLTRARWRVLAAIHLRGGVTQGEISATLDVGPVATGHTIDRLDEAQRIERRVDRSDRRVLRLYVKAAAIPALERLRLLGDIEEQAATIGISTQDIERLSALLENVIDNLNTETAI
jgi:DNA-binding MarR family transcriptional regulator